MPIKLLDPMRPGDVVTLMVVPDPGPELRTTRLASDALLRLEGRTEYLSVVWYKPTRTPLEPGVRVRHRTQPATGVIRAVVGPWAWVEWDHFLPGSVPLTFPLIELEADQRSDGDG